MKEIYQLYDKAFKRILTLSDKAVINLINGLFGTDYPITNPHMYVQAVEFEHISEEAKDMIFYKNAEILLR